MHQKSKINIAVGLVFRVLLVTVIFTLLGFAIGLFCGIGAGALYGVLRHIHPDMTMAYKFVAVPFALMAFVISFFAMLFIEIRQLRHPLELHQSSALRRTS